MRGGTPQARGTLGKSPAIPEAVDRPPLLPLSPQCLFLPLGFPLLPSCPCEFHRPLGCRPGRWGTDRSSCFPGKWRPRGDSEPHNCESGHRAQPGQATSQGVGWGRSAAEAGLGGREGKGGIQGSLKQVRWAPLNPARSAVQEEIPGGYACWRPVRTWRGESWAPVTRDGTHSLNRGLVGVKEQQARAGELPAACKERPGPSTPRLRFLFQPHQGLALCADTGMWVTTLVLELKGRWLLQTPLELPPCAPPPSAQGEARAVSCVTWLLLLLPGREGSA